MEFGTELKFETKKQLSKIEKEIKQIKSVNKKGVQFLENINAYIADCKYFLEKNDFIRAFEAIVYAWGIYETCKELGILK